MCCATLLILSISAILYLRSSSGTIKFYEDSAAAVARPFRLPRSMPALSLANGLKMKSETRNLDEPGLDESDEVRPARVDV